MTPAETLEAASAVLDAKCPCTSCMPESPLRGLLHWSWVGDASNDFDTDECQPVTASLALDGLACEDLP